MASTKPRQRYDFEKQKWTIHDDREHDRVMLNTFLMEFENRLEPSLYQIIEQLLQKREAIVKWLEKCKEEEKEIDNRKLSKRARENAAQENQFRQMDAEIELQTNEEELSAFQEIRIMYAMKELEISSKCLLRQAFPLTSIKSMFKWESLTDFLKVQGIDIKAVKTYKEIDQLRQVNNFVKHAGGPDKSIQHITEFKTWSILQPMRWERFVNVYNMRR